MPAKPVEVQAGDHVVRVSSPDRVIYEETPWSAEVTKLQVVEYYVAVEDGILRALRHRPTALERWTKGVREGMRLATRTNDRDADAFYSKRTPKGAPDFVAEVDVTFPSGRTATEICVENVATVAWAAHMGTITFHPWPVRSDDVDHPDELRIDLDPQPGTTFADAARVALEARDLLDDCGLVGFPKTSGNRGVHIYVRIEPRWDFVDVRHAAIAFGRALERRTHGVTTAWWKEERGENIFVDYNQNSRDRTIASAYSLRPQPGAPVSTPVEWDELDGLDPRTLNLHTVPQRLAERGDAMAAIDDHVGSLETLLQMYDDDIASGLTDLNYPPDYPKMPGEPPRVQPSKKVEAHWDEHGNRIAD
jgi:DNA ligase D-like protein (predicted polymerase)